MMPPRGKSEAIMGYTITPTELKSRLDKGDQLVLLDVREQWEFDLAKLNEQATHPELLEALADEVIAKGYNLREVLRTITASNTPRARSSVSMTSESA
jgi:hypothetical protein